jgi:hypothetical protein
MKESHKYKQETEIATSLAHKKRVGKLLAMTGREVAQGGMR